MKRKSINWLIKNCHGLAFNKDNPDTIYFVDEIGNKIAYIKNSNCSKAFVTAHHSLLDMDGNGFKEHVE